MSTTSVPLNSGLIDRLQAGAVSVCNRLLAALSPEDFSLLQPQLEPVPLPVGTRLVEPNTPIEHVYFLEHGIVSVMAATPQSCRIEAGMIGPDGMTGTSVLLGTDRTPHEYFVQTPGAALRIEADDLRFAVSISASLHQRLLQFVQAFMIQTAQTALANGSHTLEQRLARWLLMCHDRVDADELFATHEFLSLMLGVRRAGVTEAAIILQAEGYINYRRGHIKIVDREGLEHYACQCYPVVRAEFDLLTA